MFKHRAKAVYLLVLAVIIGYFTYTTQFQDSWLGFHPFHLGLDLSGGSHLVYQADVSKLASADISASMSSLRDVVEKRVNTFGVSEPLVQVEQGGALSSKESQYKLIVELPGVTDVQQAASSIGATPQLEFKLVSAKDLNAFEASNTPATLGTTTPAQDAAYKALFKSTGLTGRMVSRASLQFNQTTGQPSVGLTFTSDGRNLFASITKNHIGDYLGIFLDGEPISVPIIKDAITDGQGEISGNFTVPEAQKLVQQLNFGALPVPITLISTQTIGPTLGQAAVDGGIMAGIIAFILISIFLIVWYRLPGLIAVVALLCYVVFTLVLFKVGISPAFLVAAVLLLILAFMLHWSFGLGIPIFYVLLAIVPNGLTPVTLTAAGIAGFIITVGMAVDANILIFERMKEELNSGKGIWEAMHEGFARAWTSIRDSNVSSIITGAILYYFGSTSVVTGFALVFVIGVLVSMFTAITASRLFLYAVAPQKDTKMSRFLISNGFKPNNQNVGNK
ncbi:protein translocase subunit SecD [Patescibacteria group bacterium]|nr:protein translocase subunit SecD [Patescibacteria group bacterium]MDE1946768.1 preprotein translocase subunit SecD [Patescibacteria group bacterium]MDE2011099.1 preprotein translocase subunit SecD [Patescibacteria group bacterium]MDE2233594.1 preprotein translocase subunit SecD [Patescibacteria group bacterium]